MEDVKTAILHAMVHCIVALIHNKPFACGHAERPPTRCTLLALLYIVRYCLASDSLEETFDNQAFAADVPDGHVPDALSWHYSTWWSSASPPIPWKRHSTTKPSPRVLPAGHPPDALSWHYCTLYSTAWRPILWKRHSTTKPSPRPGQLNSLSRSRSSCISPFERYLRSCLVCRFAVS